jgi:DnaJ domain
MTASTVNHRHPNTGGSYDHNNLQRSVSNIDFEDDIEVILAPNFDSENPYEVLGCHSKADTEDLDRAYRHLSRKYHPENTSTTPQQDENDVNSNDSHGTAHNRLIFQKVSQAHARATGKENVPMTQEDAQHAYENMFGKYRELYYNEGGLIGIPYSSDLTERLEEIKSSLDRTSLSLCRIGDCQQLRIVFFRTLLIRKVMNRWLCLAEIFLTGTVIAFCE